MPVPICKPMQQHSSHGLTFDPLHFGYTFSTLLGRKIQGRGRGHQPFPNKMKYHWPKVLVRPPLKRAVCWLCYPFLRIEGKFYINIVSTVDPLKRVVCWVGYPFSSVDGHHCSTVAIPENTWCGKPNT